MKFAFAFYFLLVTVASAQIAEPAWPKHPKKLTVPEWVEVVRPVLQSVSDAAEFEGKAKCRVFLADGPTNYTNSKDTFYVSTQFLSLLKGRDELAAFFATGFARFTHMHSTREWEVEQEEADADLAAVSILEKAKFSPQSMVTLFERCRLDHNPKIVDVRNVLASTRIATRVKRLKRYIANN